MERIFGTQNAGYGQMVLGFAQSVKAKVSDLLTALKLPKPLVNVLTWGVLIGLGLMLAGLIAFVTFVYFMLTNSNQKSKAEQLADELREEGRAQGRQEAYDEAALMAQQIESEQSLREYAESLHKW
ncbi:hypothetical protein [Thiopseudomonas alkaliphila]|uniref:hypothetical protein n=1 Tax=Thiopseudomonas alkaliphila TaxID=1697053 RepID=UPI00069DDE48|nr:hypothetical protein [Thiopseudomonas alkaliphila]AKX57698.1 hypothetical protein AKN89_07670 [Thiopseudomonas alkaliphila]